MELRGNWNYPTTVRFGAGRVSEIGEAVKAAKITNPLFVTDPVVAKMPMTQKALDALSATGVAAKVFSDVQPNPVESNLAAGIAAFKAGGHDGVVAFGGGSALDAGKLIALMKDQTISVFDLEDVGDWWKRANADVIAPVVALPTTSGTGSEVGRAAVVTNEKTHTKKIIFHPLMLPKVTICDPELTVGMPPVITAGTGMDAFSHGLEALCVPSYHAFADGIAAECVRLVKENLVTAYKDGTNIEARAHMMAAAAAGATAFQKGLGGIHALSHPVGSLYNTHHGLTNAVFAPYVLAFNRKAIEDKVKRLAAYIGLRPNFRAFMDFVLELREATGIPHTLAGLKVDDSKVDTIVKMAPEDPTAGGNPVKLDRRAARTIFMRALEGRV
jgi:alcohol dehydrogenase class IV